MTTDELIERIARQIRTVPGLPDLPTHRGSIPFPPAAPTLAPIVSYLDHTLLKPDATPSQVEQLCQEARHYGFASVCANPCYVSLCVRLLAGSKIVVGTVAGFPLGASTTEIKVSEARQACQVGAREVDMVLPIGRLKAGDYRAVFEDLARVVAACHAEQARCKVIIETALLDDEEKVAGCLLAAGAKADFVKTSTGFAAHGATVSDVELMRRAVGPMVGVKAAGGVRSLADARAMLRAGATRIGTSASVVIAQEEISASSEGRG
jgi:deoxyribose-phosphate aldolase